MAAPSERPSGEPLGRDEEENLGHFFRFKESQRPGNNSKMGGSQSTRKITLVNDDKAGVIKLSESLAHRLRGQIEGQQAAPVTSGPAAAAEPAPHVTPTPVPPPMLAPSPSPVFPAPQLPEPPKISEYIPEPEPSVIDAAPMAEPSAPQEGLQEAPLVLPLKEEGSPPDVGIAIKSGAAPTLSQPGGNIPPWSIYAEEAHLMVMRLREEKETEIKKLNLDWHDKMEAREEEFMKISQLSEEQVAAALKDVENLFMKATCSPVCQNQQEAVMNCYSDHPSQSLRCAREVEQFTQCVDLSRLQSVMRQKAN